MLGNSHVRFADESFPRENGLVQHANLSTGPRRPARPDADVRAVESGLLGRPVSLDEVLSAAASAYQADIDARLGLVSMRAR